MQNYLSNTSQRRLKNFDILERKKVMKMKIKSCANFLNLYIYIDKKDESNKH